MAINLRSTAICSNFAFSNFLLHILFALIQQFYILVVIITKKILKKIWRDLFKMSKLSLIGDAKRNVSVKLNWKCWKIVQFEYCEWSWIFEAEYWNFDYGYKSLEALKHRSHYKINTSYDSHKFKLWNYNYLYFKVWNLM